LPLPALISLLVRSLENASCDPPDSDEQ
jgi:hypothetical protein